MEQRHELGHGVRVLRETEGTFILVSTRLAIPLRIRQGRIPGTAVAIDEELFEVKENVPSSEGWRWRLVPWPESEAARTSFQLDAARLEQLERRSGEDREWEDESQRLRRLLPLAGFAPGSWQERWETEYAYPAATAVAVSCLLEGFVGGVGVIQLATVKLEGWWLPVWLRWLVIAGPFLVAEALFRLTLLLAIQQPIGSVLGLVALLFHRPPRPEPVVVDRSPEVVKHDLATGHLELASPVVRTDWTEGGVLQFREKPYRLVRAAVGGGTALYTFARSDGTTPATLRLVPQPEREEPLRKPKDGLLVGATKILLFSFAPGRLQEDWAELSDISPLLLTTFSAVIEAFGGAVNLIGDHASGWWLLDVFFLLEGLGRLIASRLKPGAVGSLLGLPFLPLYRRWLKEKTEEVLDLGMPGD